MTYIREWGNRNDVFAVAVQSDGNIVGHIPRQISCICMLFICRGVVLNVFITGLRRYSRDLPQGYHIKKFILMVHEKFVIVCSSCLYQQ